MNLYDKKNLEERVCYEYAALDFVRFNLYPQIQPGIDTTFQVNLKDYKSDPDTVHCHAILPLAIARISQEAINETLTKVVPLIFTSSFKVQDMITEWILQELPAIKKALNKDNRISFNQKINHLTNGNLPSPLPSLFQEIPRLKECFCMLYTKMADFRHEIIHRSHFNPLPDGSLQFAGTTPRVISRLELGAYVSFICLLVKLLLNNVPQAKRMHYISMLHHSLHILEPYHEQPLLKTLETRLIEIRILAHVIEDGPLPSPLNISIPIDSIKARLKEYKNAPYILSVVAEDQTTRLEWTIPQQSIKQRAELVISDIDDPAWSHLCKITRKG